MIKLDVQEYCHDCPCFEAETDTEDNYFFDGHLVVRPGDTIIRCENRNLCARLMKHFEQKKAQKQEEE